MKDRKKEFTIALCNIANLVSFGCKDDFKEPIIKWLNKLQELFDSEDKALDKAIKTLTELDHEMYKDDNCQMSEKDWKEYLLSEASK